MLPMASPARRVLGEKDANASLNITSPQKLQRIGTNTRVPASPRIQSKVLNDALNTIPASPRIGQKRRITEVEGVEARDWDEEIKASQVTDVVSDSASETDQMETSMLSTRSAADTTMTSFGIGASQENLDDQQFEMLEPEMSQRTLDKIHAVTLPQNTSQPSQFQDRPELRKDTSQDSVGMSNFLNFHSDPSSQASDGMRMINSCMLQSDVREDEVDAVPTSEKQSSEEDQRKSMMEEKAAQLRTRLQLAFFKVETRQTNTPFSRLKIPESRRQQSLPLPSLLPPSSTSSHRQQAHSFSLVPNERTGLSPEARIAALRAQATMQNKSSVRSLNSLPMPQINPTAFSARWTSDAPSVHSHGHPTLQPTLTGPNLSNETQINIPSSPPISNHSLHIHEDDTATAPRSRINSSVEGELPPIIQTPMLPTLKSTVNINEQLSSPPLSQGGDEGDDEHIVDQNSDVETRPSPKPINDDGTQPVDSRLTSSMVQGEAASGLLQLMRSGAVNVENMRGPMCGL